MTKLVVVLAVVAVVILVVVFVAVRNMRAEDPEEFADRPRDRAGDRGGRDEPDLRYDRREPAGRPPARAGRNGRPAGRQAGNGYRPATEGPDQRRGAPPPRGGPERRRSGEGRTAESLASARPRQAPGRPPGDSSEWDSSEWEKLSDIDYWTELASNKPLTTTAQPAEARPAVDRDAETAALHGPVPRGGAPRRAPRRDPVTGLPVRDLPEPADAGLADPVLADTVLAGNVLADSGPADTGLADTVLSDVLADNGPAPIGLAGAAAGRAGFAAAPVPASPAQDPMLPPPVRAAYAAAPPPAAAAQDQMRPLAEPYAPAPKHAGPAGFPGPDRGASPVRPPVDPDDDPLTSPSFPKVSASDSRSYHNGRADAPAGGSHAPGRHLAPTQQFASYAPPAPQRASARHASGQHTLAADIGGDTDRTNPNGYLPDPLLDGNPYPTPAASAPTSPVPPAARPTGPRPAAPASAAPIASASGNPYGSYVTPGSHAAASYDEYPGMPGNGHGSYLPTAVPEDTGHAGNGYWQPTAPPGYSPGASASGYQAGPAQDPATRDVGAPAEHRNGHGRHHQAAYLPGGYSAGSPDQAGYPRQDPYGHNGYGGYPEYGTAGR
jgi:hypothetical protein